jgi:RNA polymerase sigma factor (sigma-70 family)
VARFERDDLLLERCRAGDAAAWDALVSRYRRLVWSVILEARLSPEASEDAFQQVFAALVEHIDAIRDEGALPNWLITTAKRCTWRMSAKSRRERERGTAARGEGGEAGRDGASLGTNQSDIAAVADERISPADLTRLTERQLVRDGLERLGGKCRDLLEALFSAPAEPNYTLISARLGLRVGSIGPTRARCLEKLSVILGHLGFGPEPEVATTDAGQERSSDRPKTPGQSRATPTNNRSPDD